METVKECLLVGFVAREANKQKGKQNQNTTQTLDGKSLEALSNTVSNRV